MTASIGAIRDAPATKLWGVSGHCSTPEPAKRPAFNAVTFGAIIAIAYCTYRRAASRVGHLTQYGDLPTRLAPFSLRLSALHSIRNATIGSTLVARRAGT